MKITNPRNFAIAALAVCLATWSANQAEAISISIDSITQVSPNTNTAIYYGSNTGGNFNLTGNGQRQSSYDSQVSVLNAGTSAADVLNAAVTAGTRYASTQTSSFRAMRFWKRRLGIKFCSLSMRR
jgi:hypothetical protein